MWVKEYVGKSAARPRQVFSVLADVERWREWNDGVRSVEMQGPFAAGTSAIMVLPDDTELPFVLTRVETDRGFDDLTEVPGAGVSVRVRHQLTPDRDGTLITYTCEVEGPEDVAEEVGGAVSADFPVVIAALAARAEGLRA